MTNVLFNRRLVLDPLHSLALCCNFHATFLNFTKHNPHHLRTLKEPSKWLRLVPESETALVGMVMAKGVVAVQVAQL